MIYTVKGLIHGAARITVLPVPEDGEGTIYSIPACPYEDDEQANVGMPLLPLDAILASSEEPPISARSQPIPIDMPQGYAPPLRRMPLGSEDISLMELADAQCTPGSMPSTLGLSAYLDMVEDATHRVSALMSSRGRSSTWNVKDKHTVRSGFDPAPSPSRTPQGSGSGIDSHGWVVAKFQDNAVCVSTSVDDERSLCYIVTPTLPCSMSGTLYASVSPSPEQVPA